jgi:RNA polymerase sigma-70 factor (ECF subfamily)
MTDLSALYEAATAQYGDELSRLARGYEANEALRQELLQEIHLALWRSLPSFGHRCGLRTWVHRVAHNVGATHVLRAQKGGKRVLITLDEVEATLSDRRSEHVHQHRDSASRLLALIHGLQPLDRQLMLLYLEGEDATAIAETTGLSPPNVATKIHRIKKVLSKALEEGGKP